MPTTTRLNQVVSYILHETTDQSCSFSAQKYIKMRLELTNVTCLLWGREENGLREVVSRLNGLSELNQVTSDGDKEACDIHE